MSERRRLEEFIRANPGLADAPFIIIDGKPMSPREALENLRRRISTKKIRSATSRMKSLHYEHSLTMDYLLRLAEDHYLRNLSLPPPYPTLYWIKKGEKRSLTFQECLEEVRNKTDTGKWLARKYEGLLKEMARRLAGFG